MRQLGFKVRRRCKAIKRENIPGRYSHISWLFWREVRYSQAKMAPNNLMSDEQSRIHRGACLCGQIRYEAVGQPVVISHCHCKDCQRGSGAGHSTGAMYAEHQFHISGRLGEFQLVSEAGNKVTRVFCPSCGSPIYGKNSGMPGFLNVTLGTLDDSSSFTPQVTIFARNRKPWDLVAIGLPTFEAQPGWEPPDRI